MRAWLNRRNVILIESPREVAILTLVLFVLIFMLGMVIGVWLP